jgi:hypothetical protein
MNCLREIRKIDKLSDEIIKFFVTTKNVDFIHLCSEWIQKPSLLVGKVLYVEKQKKELKQVFYNIEKKQIMEADILPDFRRIPNFILTEKKEKGLISEGIDLISERIDLIRDLIAEGIDLIGDIYEYIRRNEIIETSIALTICIYVHVLSNVQILNFPDLETLLPLPSVGFGFFVTKNMLELATFKKVIARIKTIEASKPWHLNLSSLVPWLGSKF